MVPVVHLQLGPRAVAKRRRSRPCSCANASSPTHDPAGGALRPLGHQGFAGALFGRPREDRVAADEIEQRLGLGLQRMDHVAIVSHLAKLAITRPATAPQGQNPRRVEQGFQPVVIDPQRRRWPIRREGAE